MAFEKSTEFPSEGEDAHGSVAVGRAAIPPAEVPKP